MKKYIVLLLSGMVVLNLHAQEETPVDGKTTKKLTKEQKIEQRKADEEATAKMVAWMVENRKFVLEADYLSNQTGERIMVNQNINFIMIDSLKITIQLASVSGIGGANGMGGITTDGMITKWEVHKIGKTKNNYAIHLVTMTHIGTYDISIDVSPYANADARISGNQMGKLNYHGRIVPIGQSRVYKGMSI
jgi:hypothetical protein